MRRRGDRGAGRLPPRLRRVDGLGEDDGGEALCRGARPTVRRHRRARRDQFGPERGRALRDRRRGRLPCGRAAGGRRRVRVAHSDRDRVRGWSGPRPRQPPPSPVVGPRGVAPGTGRRARGTDRVDVGPPAPRERESRGHARTARRPCAPATYAAIAEATIDTDSLGVEEVVDKVLREFASQE